MPLKLSLHSDYRIRKNKYKGFIPDKIMGVTKHLSQLMFVIKWKSIEKLFVVEASFMNLEYPSMVIAFYESIFMFTLDGKKYQQNGI